MKKFSRSPKLSSTAVRPATQRKTPVKGTPSKRDIRGKIFAGRLIAVNVGIDDCKSIPATGYHELMLDMNPISSFQGFPPISGLKKLSINGANFTDFRGFPTLANLEDISLKGSPVMSHSYARIALLILCPTLKTINGEAITNPERTLAKSYPSGCGLVIRSGWMPTIPPPSAEEIDSIVLKLVESKRTAHKSSQEQASKQITAPEERVKYSDYLRRLIREQESRIENFKKEIEAIRGS